MLSIARILCLIIVAGVLIDSPSLAGRGFNQELRDESSERSKKVDSLFSWFNRSTPGCAVSIMKAGETVYAQAYGMANLEFAVPLTTDAVFPVDSMSKQFTGMAIVLLALKGKLSFTDDVHKYIPELPEYGHPISIDDLLHQTSGLKDAGELMRFAGYRPPFDVQTKKAYFDIILRQRELNFLPGDQYLYSDTNYFLLGVIVERVSGQPLAEFARREIFDPLGMIHTQIRDDSSRIIPGRVSEYNKAYDEHSSDGAFHDADSHIEALGQDGVFTTLGDLARWDRNFYEPRVGGPKAIELMLQTRKLNGGRDNNYALGLIRGTYRGLPRVEHGGGGFGSDSEMIRFPEQRLSVAVLCNLRDLDPHDQDFGAVPLTKKILDIFLADQFKNVSTSAPGIVNSTTQPAKVMPPPAAAEDLNRFAGLYWDGRSESVRRFKIGNEKLVATRIPDGNPIEFQYAGDHHFRRGAATLTFTKDGAGVSLSQPGALDQTLVRVSDFSSTAGAVKEYTGTFYSDELDVTWQFIAEHDQLRLRLKNFDDEILEPAFGDAFFSSRGLIHFLRNKRNQIEGVEAMNVRIKAVRFTKHERLR